MGLFDKLTGTRRPPAEVQPVPADELRAALLGLSRPEVAYVVRYGGGAGCDVLAEWRLTEPAWRRTFEESRISHAVRIRMRLDTAKHEVRALEEQWELNRTGSPTSLGMSRQYTRGASRTVSRQWTIGGSAGRPELQESFRFDSAQLREPLRDMVLRSGWTWRGVWLGRSL
ncbi:hypothetical protein [Streptomyces sp. NBC_00083]|uniref:hypothetical protein n=1 Tax=Streptomyces sp. NBC_00083 TaxID=2975647 RepID=UPI0022523E08|nr:hypothetical protein [Streptomyces sp. NBC_00083]MCX5381877.1 hypothetical protein [Streptomyces sp. NBC_00083]